MIRRSAVVLAILCCVLGLSVPIAQAAPPTHDWKTWTPDQAQSASLLLHPTQAAPAANVDADAFADRVSASFTAIQSDLGDRFVSAAIDGVAGNRLVVHVQGSAADIQSQALADLDGSGGEVRIVDGTPAASNLVVDYQHASTLVNETLGGAKVVSVSRDDLANSVVVGVDGDVAAAQAALTPLVPGAIVVQSAETSTADGGVWGQGNVLRSQTPVAGGETIADSLGDVGCTSAFPASRLGQPVLITAGHCAAESSGSWYLATSTTLLTSIGSNVQTLYSSTSTADAAAVSITTGASRNCIVRITTCDSVVNSSHQIIQGMPIVKDGSTSGETNGVVLSAGSAVAVGQSGAVVDDAIIGNNCVQSGDSGGPLFSDNHNGTVVPLGITSATVAGIGCDAAGYFSIFQNWSLACPQLHVDGCPAVPDTSRDTPATRRLDVFTVQPNGSVTTAWWASNVLNNEGWAGPAVVPGLFATPGTSVAATQTVDQGKVRRLDVFVTRPDGSVWTAWWSSTYLPNGGWQGPAQLPGIFAAPGTSPAAAEVLDTGGVRRLDVFVTRPDGSVWTSWWSSTYLPNGGWQGPAAGPGVGAVPGSSPSAAETVDASGVRHIDIFVGRSDQWVWTSWWASNVIPNGGWQGPADSPAMPLEYGWSPAAAEAEDAYGVRNVDIFTTYPDGTVLQGIWASNWVPNGGWLGVAEVPGLTSGTTGSAPAVAETVIPT